MSGFDDATLVTMNAYQQIAGEYAERHKPDATPDFWWRCLERFAIQVRANPVYQANPTLPVIDVGCGPARDTLALAQMGFSVRGTDLSEAMLAEASRRIQGEPAAERISFYQMDMRALDMPDASCAGLWSSASFLHIPKSENLAVLKEFARLLVPGGPLLLIVKEHDGGADERYEGNASGEGIRFFARYRGSELWTLLEQVGLEVTEISTTVDKRFAALPRWLGVLATKGRVRDECVLPLLESVNP